MKIQKRKGFDPRRRKKPLERIRSNGSVDGKQRCNAKNSIFYKRQKMCASTRETEKKADTKLKKNIQTKAQQAEETTTMKKQTHH